jgi:hypothetical protein
MKFLKRTLVFPLVLIVAFVECCCWWFTGDTFDESPLGYFVMWCRK